MNFLISDGTLMAATRRRKTLFFSARSAEGSPAPQMSSIGTRLEQLVIASEELCGEPHWHPVPEDAVIAVDGELVLRLWQRSQLIH